MRIFIMMLLSFLEKHFHKHQKVFPLPRKGASGGGSIPSRGSGAMGDVTAGGGGSGEEGRGAGEEGRGAGGIEMRRRENVVEDGCTRQEELAEAEAEMIQVRWTLIVILCTAFACYVLGVMGASLAWMLLLLILVGTVTHGRITTHVRSIVRREAQRSRRRSRAALCPLDETAEWLNFLLNRWWIFSSPSIFNVMKGRLEPLLNDAKPAIVESVELREFSLGDATPEVTAVRGVYDAGWAPCRSSQPSTPSAPNGGAFVQPPTVRRRRTYSGKTSWSAGVGVDGLRRYHHSFSSVTPASTPSDAVLLDKFPVHRVALEADLRLDSDDFRMVLKTRLFGKDVGMDLDVAVEKLSIAGRVRATLTMDASTPFPHFSRLVLTFLHEPHVCFSIRILKSMQLMELPVLREWINSVVMESLTSSLVDPGHLTLKLASKCHSRQYYRRRHERQTTCDKPPCEEEINNTAGLTSTSASDGEILGVFTAKISVTPPKEVEPLALEEHVWFVMTFDDQRKATTPRPLSAHWLDSVSFLMYAQKTQCWQSQDGRLTPNSQTKRHQVFTVKVKSRQGLKDGSSATIASFDVPIDSSSLEFSQGIETTLSKKPGECSVAVPIITLRLEYAPLPPVFQSDDFNSPNSPPVSLKQHLSVKPSTVGGVIFVWIHGAQDLCSSSDQCECNPYCKIFLNGKKVKTTHFVRGSANPRWNSRAQFLVSNYTQANFSFFVYSWNVKKADEMSKKNMNNGGSGGEGGERPVNGTSTRKKRHKSRQKMSTESSTLGVTSVCLVHHSNIIWRRSFPLAGRPTPVGCAPATVSVSMVFCPVNSIGMVADKITKRTRDHMSIHRPRSPSPSPYATSTTASSSLSSSSSAFSSFEDNERDSLAKRLSTSLEDIPFYRSKRNSNHWIQQAKLLLTQRAKDNQDFDASSCNEDLHSKSQNQPVFELGLIRANDLVAKDLNGFSDPYCEVRVDGQLKYRSSVRKKTLNPVWEETTIIELPTDQQTLQVDLWDHDVLGKHDFLGRVIISAGEIRQACSIYNFSQVSEGGTEADLTGYHQWYQLSDIKSGSIQLRFRPITDLNGTLSQGNSSVNSFSSSKTASASPLMDRSAKTNRLLNCPLAHPPPPSSSPPTLLKRPTNKFQNQRVAPPPPIRTHSSLQKLNHSSSTEGSPQFRTATIHSSIKMRSRFDEASGVPRVTVTESNNEKTNSVGRSQSPQRSATPDSYFPKKSAEYSSFRVMKQKVKRGLNLRRFRSEANVQRDSEEKRGVAASPVNPLAPRGSSITLSIEPRGGGEADATELLNGQRGKDGLRMLGHAMSQPNLLLMRRHMGIAASIAKASVTSLPMTPSPSPSSSPSSSPQQAEGSTCKRPTDLNVVPSSGLANLERYVGVEGRVIQAQGLNVARVAQLYCRVKMFRPSITGSKSQYVATGKTLAKSRLLPSVPNPHFDLSFQVNEGGGGGVGGRRNSGDEGIPSKAILLFEIRSSGNKDILASRRATLQELLSSALPGSNEVRSWLSLGAGGASLEVELAHGRETKKSTGKGLFRSWSVHRIGKI